MRILRRYVAQLQSAAFASLELSGVRLDGPSRQDSKEALQVRIAMHSVQVPDVTAVGKKVAAGATKTVQKLLPISPLGPGTGPLVDAWRQRNVHLISSIPDDMLPEVTQVLANSANVRQDLVQRFDVARSRADLIARDQVLKLNGQVTEHLHRAAGVTRYKWNTSLDERVREGHQELAGTIQSWDSPPDTGQGDFNHPGGDYQCRCVAIPVLDDDDG